MDSPHSLACRGMGGILSLWSTKVYQTAPQLIAPEQFHAMQESCNTPDMAFVALKERVDGVRPKAVTVVLPATSWNETAKTQIVSVAGVLADGAKQAITPMPAPASWEAAGKAGVRCTAQAAGSLTFACSTMPTTALTYYVLIQEVQG